MEETAVEKPWLSSYPDGVPATINLNAYTSLVDLFESSARQFADRPAFHCMGTTLTFAALEADSRAFAAWLQAQGVERGTRVALMMPNVLQYPVCLYGTLRAGCTVVNVNPLYTARELEHQLNDSGAETIVILENFAHVLEAVIARTKVRRVVVASLGDLLGLKGLLVNFVVRNIKKLVPEFTLPNATRYNAVIQAGRGLAFQPVAVGHEDIAFLQYTGGTTGVSKGAMLLHRNIIANIEQMAYWLAPGLDHNAPSIITALPLYHIFSLTVNCLLMTKLGGLNILIPNPRDIAGFIKELRRHKYTIFTGVNTLFNALLNHPEFSKLDFSSLKITAGGGMAVQKAVADRWQALTGRPLFEGYGLTETSPTATMNPLNIPAYSGTIGVPLSATEITIRDDARQDVAYGVTGEICIRGPQVMPGYWQRPDETAHVLDADGWFYTGDIGVMDARGFTTIVDRKKDMILVSGFNVYPNEIEQVVALHPGVLECAAVGVADEHSTEAVKLFVVKRDPGLDEAALFAHCKEQLTAYKRPKYIEFRAELPKTNVGKILRRALRETHA